jgi:hypothetical protein
MLWKENKNIKTTKIKQVSKESFSYRHLKIVDGKLNDHDDAIRKLQQEIKMIKLQRRNDNPTPATADGGNDDLGGDQLQELFDAINSMGDDLRKETNDKFVTKPAFQDLKNNTNDEFSGVKKRLDDLEKE